MNSKRAPARLSIISIAATLLTAAGCAGSPVEKSAASNTLQNAQEAVSRAETNGARKHASVALNDAETKLQNARSALKDGKNKKAQYMGEEVVVDAQYALAKTKADKAERAQTQLEQSIQSMRSQMNDSSAGQQP